MIHDLASDNAVLAVVATDSPYRPAAAAKTTAAGRAVDEAGSVHEFSHAAGAAYGTQRVVHGLRRLRHRRHHEWLCSRRVARAVPLIGHALAARRASLWP